MKKINEMKVLDKEFARITRRKEELLRQQREDSEREQKLQGVFVQSGYTSPLDLVEALIRRFGIKITGENAFLRKRKRTRVTAALRDAIRHECSTGLSMNRASKKHGVSYAVVSKILQGFYDGRS
ncbi:MAG: hypothetical protein LBS68_02260 [Puniceicoccales bacterium]|jgi:hypothetical protein|nr:hypothetical protein [Puniceicoccales bacterium]